MAPKKVVEISQVTGKPKMVRRDCGKEEAKTAAKMTKAQWDTFQTAKYQATWPKPDYMQEKKPLVRVGDGGEGAYRDDTYAIVTRWTESTKIQYRPHAKAPGSKSHIRYEKYAKATTVGQSLKLGSWPRDWCYDYEHGFIKVVGGTVRDEPIDVSQVDDPSQLTEVDKALLQWYKRDLAKKFGLSLQDLTVEGGQGETLMLRAHRMAANRHAAQALAAAEKEGRAVQEAEVESTLSLWGFARNAARQNVFPDGRDWVWSDNIGLVRDRIGSIHLTFATHRYPAVVKILSRYLTDRLPAEVADFRFTSMNLNCNYAAKRHRDGNNFGPSIIKAFGDFQSGELCVFPNDDKSRGLDNLPKEDRIECCIKDNLVMFNGNSAHEVNDFVGKRFSVVYFTASCHARATEEDKATLADLGVPFPNADQDPHECLVPPEGYKNKLANKPGQIPKQLRVWPVAELDGGAKKKGKAARTPSRATASTKITTPVAAVKKLVLKKPAAAKAAR